MTEGQYQALRDELLRAVLGTVDGELLTAGNLPVEEVGRLIVEKAMPIVARELAARDAVIEQIRALAEKAHKTLHAPYKLTEFDLGHIDRDLREIQRLLSSLPSTGETA